MEKKRKIMRMVEAEKMVPGLYLIVLRADAPHNQLEIVPQRCLRETVPDISSVAILGIASGKTEAKELLVQMTEQVYGETQRADLRSYFLARIG
ncbi:MAG: hypothetical protein LUD16_11190 [Lachnospiraceae bacterium]|nr:hypothetical protein [Lachnospiraceae bacterium]